MSTSLVFTKYSAFSVFRPPISFSYLCVHFSFYNLHCYSCSPCLRLLANIHDFFASFTARYSSSNQLFFLCLFSFSSASSATYLLLFYYFGICFSLLTFPRDIFLYNRLVFNLLVFGCLICFGFHLFTLFLASLKRLQLSMSLHVWKYVFSR